jgi:hypothetical protein
MCLNKTSFFGDIECRLTQTRYEIIKWFPNEYYNAEQKLIEEGYEKVEFGNGDWNLKKDYHSINSSCFKNPESCYVIAWLKYDEDEYCTELESVGDRILNLDKKERDDFFTVYELANKMILEKEKVIED